MVMLIGFHTMHNYMTDELKYTVTFIKKYAEIYYILLPRRIPSCKRMDVQLLPTQMMKRGKWNDYIYENGASSRCIAEYMYLINIWKKFTLHIIITKLKSNFCWVCQRNFVAINQGAILSESQKIQVKMNDDNKDNNK